ncbi:MAG: DUF3488 domain-containing protein [Planctomycetales bacterium]|nr:DUF3488 domain-containing protein [Planctomycetales bacterium]
MERLERRLQWNLAAQVVLGASLLSGTQGGSYLLSVALVGAIVSLTLVDGWKVFYLGRLVSNLVALVVAFYPLFDFFNKHNEAQLLSIAQLLVNLQVVLMLERKTSRIYWQIFVLSVLQVVVASALRFDLQGGLMYVLYAIVASSAMVLMLSQRDLDRIQVSRKSAEKSREESDQLAQTETPAGLLHNAPVLIAEPGNVSASTLRAFHARSLGLTIMAIGFSTVLFYVIPRAGEPWMNRRGTRQGEVGFTDRLTFDETGQLLESENPVLRVSFEDPETNERTQVNGGVYLRGTTLHHYDVERGQPTWLEDHDAHAGVVDRASERGMPTIRGNSTGYLRQTVSMPPSGERYLFTDYPFFFLNRSDSRIAYNGYRNCIVLSQYEQQSNEPLRYTLAVTSYSQVGTATDPIFKRNRFFPYYGATRSAREMPFEDRQDLLQLPPTSNLGNRFPTLTSLANEWTNESNPRDHLGMMLALEQNLRAGDFTYTLDFSQFRRDPSIDPIEDFVANRRAGHCEYFASALALMLRTKGIPCRLVMGYHAGVSEYNDLGAFYDIRSRNTHVWVEAYLAPQYLPASLRVNDAFARSGCWVHLDPTPAGSDDEQTENSRSIIDQADQAYGYAQMIWDDYVVGLDDKKQSESFGGSLRGLFDVSSFEFALERAFSNGSSSGPAALLIGLLAIVVIGNSLLRTRRTRGVVGKLLGVKGARLLRRVAPRLARWMGVQSGAVARQAVPFYERLEDLLSRYDVERGFSETPAEFAERLPLALAGRCDAGLLEPIVEALIRDYYAVRFGGQPLDTLMRQRAEASLESLARLLATPPQPPAPIPSPSG